MGIVGLPASYGGLETCVENLVQRSSRFINYTIYCSSKFYDSKLKNYHGAKLVYVPLKANGWQSILYDYVSIINASLFSDVILIMGVSGATILPIIKILFPSKKYLVNIDGLEWKRDKWNPFAKFILRISEKIGVKFANNIISDNLCIQKYVQEFYNKTSTLIEYGGDNSLEYSTMNMDEFRKIIPYEKYGLFTCRIEPENNIDVILEAFRSKGDSYLVGIGNWTDSEYGRKLIEKYSNYSNILLKDYISDQSLLNLIKRNCYIYVHGHSAGGTNPSLVEAMYLGLPIIAYNVPYNRETTENKAIYFNDNDDLLVHLNTLKDLDHLSEKMREIANRRYNWDVIVKKYESIYEDII